MTDTPPPAAGVRLRWRLVTLAEYPYGVPATRGDVAIMGARVTLDALYSEVCPRYELARSAAYHGGYDEARQDAYGHVLGVIEKLRAQLADKDTDRV